jgi:mannosyltransferase OCH1-like enzyme
MMTTNYKIPFIVHQTFYTTKLPPKIVKIIQDNKNLNPNFKFIFYDDQDCVNFIKTYFNERIYNAYMMLNDCYGAMKADFFRYCVLYKIGGVYLDIKSQINIPLRLIIKEDDSCILDIPRNDLEPWRKSNPTYEQWLLIFEPSHPYLNEMIEQMVKNIENKYEPQIPGYVILNSKQKILQLTGPDALSRAINTCITNNIIKHRNIDYYKYFTLSFKNYHLMYTTKKHYSQYNEPLYKQA